MKRLVKPFGITIAGTLVSTALGVVSNKIVAMVGGPEVSALVAMFRQLYAGVANGLAVGADTTVVQGLAADASVENRERTYRIIGVHLLVSAVVLGATAGFLGPRAARLLLGPGLGSRHAAEVRFVIAFSFIGLCLTFVVALLNASLRVKRVVAVNIVGSLTTAAATYFVLRGFPVLGPALVVGLGNVVGVALGAWFLRDRLRAFVARTRVTLGHVLGLLRPGLLMVGLTFMNLGVMLAVQALIARTYGLYALGLYSASYTIISALMMLSMSPMKSYVLPALGRLGSRAEKGALLNEVFRLTLLVIFPVALVLFVLRGRILSLLYSHQFTGASALLAVEVVGVVPRVVTWVLTIYLISDGLFKAYALTDALKAILVLGGCIAVVRLGAGIVWIPWAFAGAETVCATTCALYTARVRGLRLTWSTGALVVAGSLAIAGVYLTDWYRHAL